MKQIVLLRYPQAAPDPADFALRDAPDPVPAEGEALVEVSHLSMDPFPRMRMRADARVGPPMALGACVEGRGIGRVRVSRSPLLAPGDLVAGELGWREQAALPAAALHKLDAALGPDEQQLSLFGPSGLTAYFALHALGAPRPGETVAIAPAAGSVGVLAGQIARQAGARVVGIAGPSQIEALAGFGYDAGVDHRDAAAGIARACPDGIDLFVDGVGGATHDAVLAAMRPRGRVVLLGFIAGYSAGPAPYGSMLPLLLKRLRVDGFLLADWQDRFGEALAALSGWARAGALRPVETIWDGLDQAPAAFAALFADAPPGKQIVKLRRG